MLGPSCLSPSENCCGSRRMAARQTTISGRVGARGHSVRVVAADRITYDFDRFLRYDELRAWLEQLAADHPALVTLEVYGQSFEGRDLLLATVTDSSTGAPDTKPAHWVDASIHAVELTATVAACNLLQHLVDGFADGDATVVRALRTRTFYVVPRVNPDGAEWALADRPRWRRSSVRPWPHADAHLWPGLAVQDIDGDGRILQMRIPDPDGAWMPHPDEPRLLVAVPPDGSVPAGAQRYRTQWEGLVEHYDGFTVPTPPAPEGLDMNRNFPAAWGTNVGGSGDHPLSEPEIDALVRAVVARPNICGYNAFHTSGGVLLRPSSVMADSTLHPRDLWVYKQLGEQGTALTGYTSHSVFEDFTFDKNDTMSGAADDWAFEHLGVYSWTTEFWDIVHAATGTKQSTYFWYVGPTTDEALAVLRWLDQQTDPRSSDARTAGFVDWYPFEHPQLGAVELGGWNDLFSWTNPPGHLLHAEVAKHAEFAVFQALASPCLEIKHSAVTALGDDTWRVEVGVANTGWLPTHVTARAANNARVRPIVAELLEAVPEIVAAGAATRNEAHQFREGREGSGVEFLGGPARVTIGQLGGGVDARFRHGRDGTPDRALVSWTIRAAAGTDVTAIVHHDRAGRDSVAIRLE